MKQSTHNYKLLTLIISILIIISGSTSASFMAPSATSKTVTLSWIATGDDGDQGTASVYDIRYATFLITDANWDQATQVNDEPVPQITGSSESYIVQNLLPSTTYYFAIKVGDEVPNWSILSNVVTVTTSAETDAPSIIADLASHAQTATSISLSWTAPGDDGSTGTAAQYDLRYYTSPITAANWDSASQITNEPNPSAAGTVESLTVTGLSESTVYYFAIKTADEVPNWSALSNLLSVSTTGDQTPPAAINDLQASTGQEQGQLTVNWTAPGDDGLDGRAAAYLMRYSTEMITEFNWLAPVTDSSNFVVNPLTPSESGEIENHTIQNLAPGEIYFVALKTIDDIGNSSDLSNVTSGVAKLDLSLDDDLFATLPEDYQLLQNYPNPFNPTTEITFALPENAYVNLDIYNSLGQKVSSLADDQYSTGEYSLSWNGTDDNGQPLASGVYFYRIKVNDFYESKKMVMLK